MQQMQAQLQQMQAVANDAQQIAAAQQNVQQGAQQAMAGANGQPGQGGQGQGQGGGQGQWGAAPNPQQGGGGGGQQPGQGGQGGGKGFGSPGTKAEAPYTLKQEVDTSDRIDSGKLLATTFVKASALKGENKLELKQIAANAEKDETDEIDQDRISRQAQGVVREYFKTMENDAAQPTTQP
jgi:hypothetical protein